MSPDSINWLAVIASVVAMQVIGTLWYSPILFGKAWQKAVGMDAETKPPAVPAIINAIVMALITSIAMALLVNWTGVAGIAQALTLGLIVGIGFCVAVIATNSTFEGRPTVLVLINSGHYLTDILAITLILTLWK